MAGAIGLKGIHNVTGVCDLCGNKCSPDMEELNALDCTYKDCPPMVYHQDCLEKYLKSIRLEKNRKTGFKCPRGCGKGTRYSEACRGKIDKSHPIHVRHDSKKDTQTKRKEAESHPNNMKKIPDRKAPLNVHDLNLVKLVPAKTQKMDVDWSANLTRSKSLDKSNNGTNRKTKPKRKTRRTASATSFPSPPTTTPTKSEVTSESGSVKSTPSAKSHGDSRFGVDNDQSSETGSLNMASGNDEQQKQQNLPSLEEEARRQETFSREEIHEQCKKRLVQWKSAMLAKQLHEMGFETWKALSAVHIFGTNVSEAIQWLVENGDIPEASISALLQNHPPAEICIEFELRSILHACHQYDIDAYLLDKAVIQFEGDLTSAIDSLTKIRPHEYAFPDCDLSLGIVHSESPLIYDTRDYQLHERTLSDDLMLGGVLGSALDEYKRGDADFTDIAAKDLGYHASPLSRSTSSHSTSFQDQLPYRQLSHGCDETGSMSSTLRHFIGNILE